MTTKDPAPVAILAARIMRAYPTLSPFSAAALAAELCAIERAQRRHAERCCSGADGGYVKAHPGREQWKGGTTWQHDPEAEERAGKRIVARCGRWLSRLFDLSDIREGTVDHVRLRFSARAANDISTTAIELQGDPRGPVLLVRLPGEPEAVTV